MIPTDYSALRALVVSAPLRSALSERPLDVQCPKTPQIRSFSYGKWLLFGVLRTSKVMLFHASMEHMTFYPGIISFFMRKK